jgi:hypothetical protein
MKRTFFVIENENVNLLAEVRTLKEEREEKEKEVQNKMDELNELYNEAKLMKDEIEDK